MKECKSSHKRNFLKIQIYQTIVCLLDLYQSTEKACTGLAFSPGGRNIFFYKDILSWQKEEETRTLSPKLKQVLARFDRYEQRRSEMPSFVLQRLHSVECTDFSEALHLKNEFIAEKGALTNCTINKIHRVGRALNKTTFLLKQFWKFKNQEQLKHRGWFPVKILWEFHGNSDLMLLLCVVCVFKCVYIHI